MILLIDNFDSFTFNLYQYLGELGEELVVYRNNQLTTEQIVDLNPKAIILSPGPGKPQDAGVCMEVVRELFNKIPILGICLGHQAIGEAFGGVIQRAEIIKHGKTSLVTHNDCELFSNLPDHFEVMRYHSLIVEEVSLPEQLECIAHSNDDKVVMAIKHKQYPVYGLQFHPESIGTPTGKQILNNFLLEVERMSGNEKVLTPVS
jgi:anthranilate synthase component II